MTGYSGTIDWLLYTENGHAPPPKKKVKTRAECGQGSQTELRQVGTFTSKLVFVLCSV